VDFALMNYDFFGLGEARAILQSCLTKKAMVLAKNIFSAIFESVNKHHFLKN
jgi:hypothetical protein